MDRPDLHDPTLDHHGIDYEKPNFDDLGIAYISIAVVWSVIVTTGLLVLWQYRTTHAVRIRNFWVTWGTVTSTHIYLMLILLVYPLNGLFKCGWEFWIMSIWLPLSFALFQAQNIRLYSYHQRQLEVKGDKVNIMHVHNKCCTWRNPRPRHWWKHASIESRTYAGIMIGMMAQFVVTCVLYFGSKKFHKSYGFFSDHVSSAQCRRGYEWIPSVFQQFFYTAIFGPFILLRIKDISDTHYWALQTKLAVYAGLPGTPLWLLFVYATGDLLKTINTKFPPSGWFIPGLVTIQIVSICFPLFDVYKYKKLELKFDCNRLPFGTTSATGEKAKNPYAMDSLEMHLKMHGGGELLTWAATKEFTAENIMFLTKVAAWKKRWETIANHSKSLSAAQRQDQYEEAAVIYFTLVNPHTARMNINVDHKTYTELENMFKAWNYVPFFDDSSSCSKGSSTYTENIVTPWDDAPPPPNDGRPPSSTSRKSNDSKIGCDSEMAKLYQTPVTELVPKDDSSDEEVPIPADFSIEVFQRAYDAVKRDVYLNTWVRYESAWGVSSGATRRRGSNFATNA